MHVIEHIAFPDRRMIPPDNRHAKDKKYGGGTAGSAPLPTNRPAGLGNSPWIPGEAATPLRLGWCTGGRFMRRY